MDQLFFVAAVTFAATLRPLFISRFLMTRQRNNLSSFREGASGGARGPDGGTKSVSRLELNLIEGNSSDTDNLKLRCNSTLAWIDLSENKAWIEFQIISKVVFLV
jgi:hypothetical protein